MGTWSLRVVDPSYRFDAKYRHWKLRLCHTHIPFMSHLLTPLTFYVAMFDHVKSVGFAYKSKSTRET